MISRQELIGFEEEIKNIFLEGKIRAPVHLSRGNETPLIRIFKSIKREDWVFSTHRSHYHALLKGIDPEWVRNEILAGRSMHFNNKEHNFFSSAIVGGCLPIALGVAMGIKRKRTKRHVWVFVGDMAAESGVFHECTKYAARHKLPMTFVVEDNRLSTNTPTQLTWGKEKLSGDAIDIHNPYDPFWGGIGLGNLVYYGVNIIRYSYRRGFPHINVGKFVEFK